MGGALCFCGTSPESPALTSKNKASGYPSSSQLAVWKANMALSAGLDLAGKPPSPVWGVILASSGAQVIPHGWGPRRRSLWIQVKQSLAVPTKTPESAAILEKNLPSDWPRCWSILSAKELREVGNFCQRTDCRRIQESPLLRFLLEWTYSVSIPQTKGTIVTFWLYQVLTFGCK